CRGLAMREGELQRQAAHRDDIAVFEIVTAADRLAVDGHLATEPRRDVAVPVAGDGERDARGRPSAQPYQAPLRFADERRMTLEDVLSTIGGAVEHAKETERTGSGVAVRSRLGIHHDRHQALVAVPIQ